MKLEQLTSGLARSLYRLPDRADALMAEEAEEALVAIRKHAPLRTGGLRRSLHTRQRRGRWEIASTHPGALHIDRGGTIRAGARQLVVPLVPGYRHGRPGYVTLPGRGNTRAIVPEGRMDRVEAVLARQVRTRPTNYISRGVAEHLERAAERALTAVDEVLL